MDKNDVGYEDGRKQDVQRRKSNNKQTKTKITKKPTTVILSFTSQIHMRVNGLIPGVVVE